MVEVDRARDRAVTEKHIDISHEIRAERRFHGVKIWVLSREINLPELEELSALTSLSSLKNRFK